MRTDWEKGISLVWRILNLQVIFDIGEIKYWHVLGYLAGKIFLYSPLNFLDTFIEKVPLVQECHGYLLWINQF